MKIKHIPNRSVFWAVILLICILCSMESDAQVPSVGPGVQVWPPTDYQFPSATTSGPSVSWRDPAIAEERRRLKEEKSSLREQERLRQKVEKEWKKRRKALDEVRRKLIGLRLEEADIGPGRFRSVVTSHQSGTAFFGIGGSPVNLTKTSTEFTEGTDIASEDLRRAVSILKAITSPNAALGDEDSSFLANEAASALFGGSVRVVVPESRSSRNNSKALKEAMRNVRFIQSGHKKLSSIQKTRQQIERNLYEEEGKAREQSPAVDDRDRRPSSEKIESLRKQLIGIQQKEAEGKTSLDGYQKAFQGTIKLFVR